MMKHKDDTVGANVQGVAFLLKKNKVDAFFGTGSIPAAGKVEVTAEDGSKQVLETKNIVIATGSDVTPSARRDHRREDRRLLDRRAGARKSSGQADRGRRGRDRPRTRLGLAPSRRGSDGG